MKLIRKIFLFLLVILLSFVLYAFRVEPYRYTVENVVLNSRENTEKALRIVQFSDTHIYEGFTAKDLVPIVEAINAQEPDVVVFTGDLYDNYSIHQENQDLIEVLSSIRADTKLAIWGNRDYGGDAENQYEEIMDEAGFYVLRNADYIVEITENNTTKEVLFTGVDDSLIGSPHISSVRKNTDYSVLLMHEPDDAVQFSPGYNLVLSGHTHGGQIQVPFCNQWIWEQIGITEEYMRGMYTLSENSTLYVNPGIGTTHIHARFNVRPEITVFDIYL